MKLIDNKTKIKADNWYIFLYCKKFLKDEMIDIFGPIPEHLEMSEIMVIDSRTPDWVAKGMIPGAVNIPWTHLSEAKGADPISIAEIMTEQFGAKEQNGLFYFDDAKTLVMYCNGMWA